jgi:hypothetical protein
VNYFEDDVFKDIPESGLYLIDHNTGTGKTRETVKGMVRLCLNESFQRRQIFCSQQWKNIPVEDLRKEFATQNASEEFERRVLVIRPLLENIRDELKNHGVSIPASLHDSQEFRLLNQQLQLSIPLKGETRSWILQDRIRQDLNQYIMAFRKLVTSYLIEKYKTAEQRRKAVAPGGSEAWVGAYFPTSRCTDPDVRIILLTTTMLLLPSSLVIEKGSVVFAHDMVDDAIVYLDEFDGSKRVFLDRILSQAIRHDFDLIRACSNIAKWLPSQKLHNSLLAESDARIKSIDKKRSARGAKPIKHILEEYEEIIALFDSLMKDWRLDRNFKLDSSEKKPTMLFQESNHDHSVGFWNGGIDFLNEDINVIREIADIKSGTTAKLTGLVFDCTYALRQFAWFCKHLADNEASKSTEKHGIEFNLIFRQKFRSLLEHFNLGLSESEWILEIVENQRFSTTKGLVQESISNLFHDQGFKLTALVDGDDHEYQTMVHQYGVPMTPERILISMAKKALIIGLSATSTIPSVICNYDLEYLRSMLGSNYYEPSQQDIKKKKDEYSRLTRGYNQTVNSDKLHTTKVVWIDHSSVPNESGRIEQWSRLFNNNHAKALLLLNAISAEAKSINETTEFIIDRYYRLVQVLSTFFETSDCRALLAFFQKLAKQGDAAFNQDIIEKIALNLGYGILQDGQANFHEKAYAKDVPMLAFLTTRQLHAGAPEILKALNQGTRVLAITSYGTSGVGINLQFDAEDQDTIYIHDRHSHDKSESLTGMASTWICRLILFRH